MRVQKSFLSGGVDSSYVLAMSDAEHGRFLWV